MLNYVPGAQIQQILLNGYHSQTIVGASGIPVETRSYDQTGTNFGGSCGYSLPYNGGGCDTNQLIQGVTNYTGLDWTSFNGCYTLISSLLSDLGLVFECFLKLKRIKQNQRHASGFLFHRSTKIMACHIHGSLSWDEWFCLPSSAHSMRLQGSRC